jgi:hypothetical protein
MSWRDKDEKSLDESLAAAYAQFKAQKELKLPLSSDRLSRLEGIQKCLQLN